jgi:hypothetical protein
MSSSCAQWRGEIGAYVVGALDRCAHDQVTRHLAACTGCRADYDELVPVRDWLDLLVRMGAEPESSPAEQEDDPSHHPLPEGPRPAARTYDELVPPPRRESGTQPAAQPAGELRGIRPRARRWLPAVGSVAIAAAAVAVLVSSGAAAQTFRAVNSATGVSGHAQLHGTPTGTQIDLTASGLPGNERCILVAVTDGGTDIAGSWNATYDGAARISGTTAYPENQLTALRIESDTGSLLLSIHV